MTDLSLDHGAKRPSTRKKRTLLDRHPLASFDPRYREIWLRAATRVMPIEFADAKEAKAFQSRLQLYRAVAREAGLEEANLFYRANTSRKGSILIVGPADARYDTLLAKLTQAAASPQDAAAQPLDDLDDFVLNQAGEASEPGEL